MVINEVFRGSKVLYRFVLTILSPLLYPPCPSSPSPVLKFGQRKIWLDPHNINDISLDNSCRNVTSLHRGSLIIKKPVVVHSRDRVLLMN